MCVLLEDTTALPTGSGIVDDDDIVDRGWFYLDLDSSGKGVSGSNEGRDNDGGLDGGGGMMEEVEASEEEKEAAVMTLMEWESADADDGNGGEDEMTGRCRCTLAIY